MQRCVDVAADRGVVADGEVDRAAGFLVEQDRSHEPLDGDVRPDAEFGEVVGGVADLLGRGLDLLDRKSVV